MDYPWETIIKLYRKERGHFGKDYVSDWSDDFREYLSVFGNIQKGHREDNVRDMVVSWLVQMEEEAIEKAEIVGCPIPSDAYSDLLIETIKTKCHDLGAKDFWINKRSVRKFIRDYGQAISIAVERVFGKAHDDLTNAALTLGLLAAERCEDSPRSSGFVIAGFGEKEIFPTLVEHYTDGYIGNDIKIHQGQKADLSRSMSASINAFAQKDMVQSFMNGFDSDLFKTVAVSFSEGLNESCFGVLEKYGMKSKKTEKVREDIRMAVQKQVESFLDGFADHSKRNFSGPIVDMVSLLPKDELANLAESLVALTSLKRRVSRGTETVGGAIDIALISKGDGFVWIKRKHYFRPELNPQFPLNYVIPTLSGSA